MSKSWKNKLEALIPPGFPLSSEINVYLTGLILATLFSLAYFVRLFAEYNNLYAFDGSRRILVEGTLMPTFYQILSNFHLGYPLLSAVMLCFILGHYTYFHMGGSHPLYLMKRIPDALELHRRCWSVPLAAIVIYAAALILLFLLYFAFYLLITPEGCLAPNQWQKIWSVIL